MTKAIQDFFLRSRLVNKVNSIIITLIPKVDNLTSLKDYRPISCCIYKCITKISANWLKVVLPELINEVRTTFIPGRKISILLAQEILFGYHKKTQPR